MGKHSSHQAAQRLACASLLFLNQGPNATLCAYLNFYFEIFVDSWPVVRNNAEEVQV